MIVGSLLLILVAVVLLVFGLANGSSGMLIGSIGASLLAAVALVVGARQDTAGRAGFGLDEEPDDRVRGEEEYAVVGARAGRAGQRTGRDTPAPPAEPSTAAVPSQPAYGGAVHGQRQPIWDEPAATADTPVGGAPAAAGASATGAAATATGAGVAGATAQPVGQPTDDEYDDEDPLDEPAPQAVSPADVARLAGLRADVLVIDGRPRYHLPGCVHLLGRESEPLPVSEAVELGFTPCSLCEPASALLARG